MFEIIRGIRKFNRAVHFRRTGDKDEYYRILKEIYELAMRPSVNRTSPSFLSFIVQQALTALVLEANRRGDSALAEIVLDSAYAIWKENERKHPHYREIPEAKQWVRWVEAEKKRRNSVCVEEKSEDFVKQ